MIRFTSILSMALLAMLATSSFAALTDASITSTISATADNALPENTPRYQFVSHNFSVDGVAQEVYLKLDRFTGKTWRFHVSNPRWVLIPEPAQGLLRAAGTASRYELYPHNYLDQNGDAQELFIRADLVTGYTWMYRGANGSWKDILQDE